MTLISSTSYAKTQTFEKKYYKIIQSIIWAADTAEVPRELVLAVCWGESSFRTKGVTHVDGETPSYGICQVKMETARFMDKLYKHKAKATPKRLEDFKVNAFYAAKYLKYHLDRYDDDWKLAVDAYNKGTAIGHKTKYVKKFDKNIKHIKKNVPSIADDDESDDTNNRTLAATEAK